jgi:hypothetical protein
MSAKDRGVLDLAPVSGETGAVGLARIGHIMGAGREQTAEELAIQAGIDATMRAVVSQDAPYVSKMIARDARPEDLPRAAPTSVASSNRTGWAKETPLEPPLGAKGSYLDNLVGKMIDNTLGPAVPKRDGSG